MNESPLIETERLSLAIRGKSILADVDIVVRPNEIVTVIGPNGAGKSTLARLILGLTAPTAGRIYRREGLVVGYLPQRVAVDSVLPLTVRRFLALTRRVDATAMRELLGEVGAAHLMHAMLYDLSGGELQRVLLARALLRSPDLLVLDEPMQGVDFSGEMELYDLITRIRTNRGCGILLISHNLHLVMAATDQVVCLNGHVCCSGKPDTVRKDPQYLALFGPRAAEGLAIYTHAHDHRHDLSGAPHDIHSPVDSESASGEHR